MRGKTTTPAPIAKFAIAAICSAFCAILFAVVPALAQAQTNSPAQIAPPQPAPQVLVTRKTASVVLPSSGESSKAETSAQGTGNRSRRGQNPDSAPGQAPSRANDPQYKADVTHLL